MRAAANPLWRMPGEGTAIPGIGTLKLSAAETGGAFEMIEFSGPNAPPHLHRARDETFFVLHGSFTFRLADEVVAAPAGSCVFVPRGVHHGFTLQPGSRALLVIAPAGLEGYFRELGRALEAGRSGGDIRRALADRYDSIPI